VLLVKDLGYKMEEYALLINDSFKEIRFYNSKPENIPHKNVKWIPVLREIGTPFEGLERGNWVIRSVDPNTIPPSSITPRQCRLLLLQQGLLSDVESMIASQDKATQITWEYALEFYRNDPLLIQLGNNLNLTEEQIDQFFIAASKL
jgi:hypothetical protein